jgi:hypothetical protein
MIDSRAHSDADVRLVQQVDRVEKRVLERGGTIIGSAIGLGSILGSFTGPVGAEVGAIVGLLVGYLVPRFVVRSHRD